MPLVLDTDAGSVEFPRLLRAPLADGRLLLVFSGVAHVNLRGESADWNRDTLYLGLSTTPASVTSDKTFVEDQVAPLVTLNSIFDKNTAVNAGFAVDSCKPLLDIYPDHIFLVCRIAARDSDAFLYRVGYHVTVTGRVSLSSLDASKKVARSLLEAEIKKREQQRGG